MSRKETMINLLSQVLNGQITSREALDFWPNIDDPTDDKIMKNAWHSLYHYDTDSDIRTKEPSYGVRQLEDLKTILDELRASLGKGGQ